MTDGTRFPELLSVLRVSRDTTAFLYFFFLAHGSSMRGAIISFLIGSLEGWGVERFFFRYGFFEIS